MPGFRAARSIRRGPAQRAADYILTAGQAADDGASDDDAAVDLILNAGREPGEDEEAA